VIMLTGIGERLNELTSPLYGADAHLDKPFELQALDAAVTRVLGARGY
jgi:DNA-binding response OmpR family regulator